MKKEKQETLFPTQTKKSILKNKRQDTKIRDTQKENIELKSLIEKQLNFISNRNDTDSVKEKEVHTGVTIDGIVEILDGVEEGEKIVASGIRTVADGAKVRVVSSDNPGENL